MNSHLTAPLSSPVAARLATPATPVAEDRGALLAVGQALRIRRTARRVLEVIEGRLWVTSSGDTADHVVVAGQRFMLHGRRDVVIECAGLQATRWRVVSAR